ncbi:helix-turn-helix transcriptional regulator [Gammaproteobacteria bacterium]|nr:helix-turn-helix transcriptional regulator [Gammaproteobacteria bacterium]
MHYWNAVKNEFVNRYAKDYPFFYTTVKYVEDEEETEKQTPIERKTYVFCEAENLYLTQREADCIYFLSQGLTIKSTAEELILSPRTVEFYLQRIKEKFGQPNKKTLLAHLAAYDYFESFMQVMREEFGD